MKILGREKEFSGSGRAENGARAKKLITRAGIQDGPFLNYVISTL